MKPAFQSPLRHLAFVVSRLALAFFILFTLTLALSTPARAQDPCAAPEEVDENYGKEAINNLNDCAIQEDIFDDKIFNINQIAGTTDSLFTLLTGFSQLHPETDQITAGRGALASAGGMVAMLYARPPASGVTYLAEKIQNINPVRPAYAQAGTIGFDVLKPVENVWQAFRNLSYAGFVIVFVVSGFMIMFRKRISSQAVASIQDSLPRVVIALILVTFSYAIVGLMIDLMFVILNVIISALEGARLLETGKSNYIFTDNFFWIGVTLFDNVVSTVAHAIADVIKDLIKFDFIKDLVGWSVGSIAGLIVAIAVLLIVFKVLMMLLMSYISIIMLTIFAPFILLMQALPGNNGSKEWFKQIAANLSVFVTVALMLLLAGILTGIDELGGGAPNAVKITGEQTLKFPLLTGGLSTDNITSLVGVGLLFMIPSAAKIVKDRFGIKEGAMGAGVGAAMAGVGAGAAATGKFGKAVAPHTPIVGAAADRMAAWNEAPKIKRQAVINEHAPTGYTYTPGKGWEKPKP